MPALPMAGLHSPLTGMWLRRIRPPRHAAGAGGSAASAARGSQQQGPAARARKHENYSPDQPGLSHGLNSRVTMSRAEL